MAVLGIFDVRVYVFCESEHGAVYPLITWVCIETMYLMLE